MAHLPNTTAAAIAVIAAAVLVAPRAQATVPVKLASATLGVSDRGPATGAVGGVRNPVEVGSTLDLTIDASDPSSGLARAEAAIGGNNATVSLCPPPASGSGAVKASLGGDCPESVSNVPLSIGVGGEGSHELRVSVTDAAGNTTTLVDQTIEVQSPPQSGPNTVTIGIGSQGPPSEPAGGVLGSSSTGASTSASACLSPKLSMKLTSKPLRYAKVNKRRVPVLLARRFYVYRGRLTCLLNGRRVSAPTGTVVHVLYKIGRRTFKSGRGTMTVHRGNLRAILGYGYTSSRTIVFRYGPINGELVQVKIPIEIARTHPKRKTRR